MDVTLVKFSCRAANVYLGAQEELGRQLKESDQNFQSSCQRENKSKFKCCLPSGGKSGAGNQKLLMTLVCAGRCWVSFESKYFSSCLFLSFPSFPSLSFFFFKCRIYLLKTSSSVLVQYLKSMSVCLVSQKFFFNVKYKSML